MTARPRATIAVVAALALVGTALALQLEASTSTGSLVGHGSKSAAATDRFHRQFGDEAIVVLVQGPLERTLLTPDLGKVIGLEGCLAGNYPKSAAQILARLPKACQEMNRLKPAKVVYGPGTFANTAAGQITQGFQAQLAQSQQQGAAAAAAARKVAKQRGYSKAQQDKLAADAMKLAQQQLGREAAVLAVRYGLTSIPSVDNPSFLSQLFFDPTKGVNQPKPRFAYLVPSKDAAMIQVRLKPNLSESARAHAIDLVERAVHDPRFKLSNGQKYTVTGIPVVTRGLADAVQTSVFVMLGAALLVMAGTLLLVFRTRRRMRLLPLALALAAAAVTYGALEVAGLDLTMASIAALPVLIGLAVDYAIQLQARFDEGMRRGRTPREAAWSAAGTGGPTIAGAALATAAGFLVLLTSPIPMVHGFAVLVIVGIVLALGCALTAGLAALSYSAERPSRPARAPALRLRRRPRPADLPPAFPRTRARLARAWSWLRPRERAQAAMRYSIAAPRRVLAAAILLAVLGWAADTQLGFQSDIRKLVPQNLGALRDANTLEKVTGVSGELDVMISGNDVLSPKTIAWMSSFQRGALAAHGYRVGDRCNDTRGAPEICPALSLTDLFQNGPPRQAGVRQLIAAVPPYFRQAVVTPDQHTATLAFGIRLMPLERQEQVVNDLRARLSHAPPGVTASVAGLPVLAADANAALSSEWRRLVTVLGGLALVFLVLLALRRRLSLAAVPLIPIALATGWSSLLLFVFGIELNPMTATLGALVIAISTEFAVLLSARYQSERAAGAEPERALELTYASTGAAVLASGATAIAGFAAVIASNITMLREFGLVTVVDLTVSLAGVMLVLPAAIVWSERRGELRLRDLDPRPALAAAFRRPPLRRERACPSVPDRQDDPFGDLDAGPRGTRAGDKLAELDERAPEPTPPQPRRPRGRYTWVVGVAAVIAIIVAGVNSLPHAGRGSRGLPAGTRLRVFAAPAVPGPIDKPANVNQSARDPAVGKTAACSVNPAGAVKLCPPFGRPVVITFIVPVGDCEDYVSRLERLRSAFPQVRFITVISTVKQKGASQLVRDRGWREEVALDENGSLLNLYRVSLCATSVFARRGGVVASTKVEAQRWAPAQLRVAVAAVGR